MPFRIIRKDSLRGTSRHVRNATYETFRFLLAEDGIGLTVTDIVLKPGVEAVYGYDQHVEIAYCIEGAARAVDLATGEAFDIAPGTLWIADRGTSFSFVADVETRLICVFTPAFSGHETGFSGDQ